MIGDDPQTDILGASNTGIDSVWFNPLGEVREIDATYEVSALPELLGMF